MIRELIIFSFFSQIHYQIFLANSQCIQCLAREFTIFCAYIPWIHSLFRDSTMILLSFWRIYYEFIWTFGDSLWIFPKLLWIHFFSREFTMISLSVSRIRHLFRENAMHSLSFRLFNCGFTLCFANSLAIPRIHYLFGEFTMNLLGFSQFTMDFREITMNSLWFQFVFRIYTLNLLSIERIHFQFSMNLLGVSLISYEFTILCLNLLWIYYIFREFTMNSLFFPEFIMLLFPVYGGFSKNSLSVTRIHYEFIFGFANSLWINYLFREVTKNSLSVSRIHYFLSNCMHSF